MATRKCKCKICGKSLVTNEAYKVVSGTRNLYYCNKEEYDKWVEAENNRKYWREEVNKLLTKIFDYEIHNTSLYREWKTWNEIADDSMIYSVLHQKCEFMINKMNTLEGSEYGKIKYLSRVIMRDLECVLFVLDIQNGKYDQKTLESLKMMTYNEFLKSDYWRNIAEYVKMKYFYKCQKCGREIKINSTYMGRIK